MERKVRLTCNVYVYKLSACDDEMITFTYFCLKPDKNN